MAMELLRRDFTQNHIEYNGFMSNHEAHAIIALHQMHATPKRMKEYADEMDKKLDRFPKQDRNLDKLNLTKESIWEHVGERISGHQEEWREYLQFFQREWVRVARELKADDENASPERLLEVERTLVNEYFPRLAPFAAGHATHPLIHLGFGLVLSQQHPPVWSLKAPEPLRNSDRNLSKEDQEILERANTQTIAGLAYLCYRGLRLDEGTNGYSSASFSSIPGANSKSLLEVLKYSLGKFEGFEKVFKERMNDARYSEIAGQFQKRVAIMATIGAQPLLECDIQWKLDEDDLDKTILEMQHVVLFLYGE